MTPRPEGETMAMAAVWDTSSMPERREFDPSFAQLRRFFDDARRQGWPGRRP